MLYPLKSYFLYGRLPLTGSWVMPMPPFDLAPFVSRPEAMFASSVFLL